MRHFRQEGIAPSWVRNLRPVPKNFQCLGSCGRVDHRRGRSVEMGNRDAIPRLFWETSVRHRYVSLLQCTLGAFQQRI